jgi:DNA-binding CsgD family transcriptional regulator
MRLGLYNEYFRRLGLKRQLGIGIALAGRLRGATVALNRAGSDFDECDRLRLNLLQPHLVQAAKNVDVFERLKGSLEPMNSACDAVRTLTAREAEVLTWISRGKTNADIADILGISRRTVEKHAERIFEKLGVETRSAAANVSRERRRQA